VFQLLNAPNTSAPLDRFDELDVIFWRPKKPTAGSTDICRAMVRDRLTGEKYMNTREIGAIPI
jgi:hypothetical protein